MLTPAPYRPCPTCSATDSTPWDAYSPDEWQIVRCGGCNLTYLRNPVEYEALEVDFAWEATYEAKTRKGGSTKLSPALRVLRQKLGLTHRSKQERLRKWFRGGHVLDIGCGALMRAIPPMTPYGIELSNALHAIADKNMRERGGYCVHGPGAEAIWKFNEGQFDGIIMHSYLEHETDLMGVLKGAHRALKTDGKVFVRVPNFGSLNRRIIGPKWCGFRYPDHVNYFTLDTLRDCIKRAGFGLTLINKVALPFDDNITVLLHKGAA
ncbi:MAG: class I SAM-dependent methyltransferase [Pseudomonadota bacterium]